MVCWIGPAGINRGWISLQWDFKSTAIFCFFKSLLSITTKENVKAPHDCPVIWEINQHWNRNVRHFDEILSQWWKLHQNDNTSVLVSEWWFPLHKRPIMRKALPFHDVTMGFCHNRLNQNIIPKPFHLSSPPGQNGCHFADDIFKCIFLNENLCILIKKFLLQFVPKGPVDNKSTLL